MKKLFFLILVCFVAPNFIIGQRKADIGAFMGTSYYMGDINPGKQLYSSSFAIGALYRHNFNDRYSLRFNGYYASLSGSDLDFPDRNLLERSAVTFNTNLLDLASKVEFNFFPYKTTIGLFKSTPYITGGIGYAVILSNSVVGSTINAKSHLTLPFGIGYKINMTKKLSAGVEWSFQKSFTDTVDGVINPLGSSILYSNDWYSFLGLFITYKFFNFAASCPAYNK